MPASRKGYKNKLLRTVEQTVAAHRMFNAQDSVLAGVSGGPDSVALLHVLIALAPRFSLKLAVAHLNHGLRQGDSDRDAKFVESLAAELELPFHIQKVDVQKYRTEHGLSLEDAARRVRYAYFWDVADRYRYNKIALGHHGDDNAELVLMNLFRGSGPLGLSGIPPKRSGRIIRPLIQLKRADIMEFLESMRLPYVKDRSNIDQRHLRNRVRHHLIPMLASSYNPKIADSLNRLTSIVSSEEEWLDEVIKPILDSVLLYQNEDSITLSISGLDRIHMAALRRIIRKAIERVKGNLRRIRFTHIDAVIHLAEHGRDYGCIDLPDRIRVRRAQDALLISKEKKALRNLDPESGRGQTFSFEYRVSSPETIRIVEIDAQIRLSEMRVEHLPDFSRTGHHTGFFDMDRLSFPLILRNFCPGDRFRPLGMSGTQKVKDFFINQKVSTAERNRCPLLLSRGKIIWVVGHRIDESVKVTSSTSKVLKGELTLA